MTTDGNRTENLQVRITPEGLAKIDELRGMWSRSEWIRRALARATVATTSGQPALRGPLPSKTSTDVKF